jgi:quinol monooxygenase YgiN
MIYKIAQYTVRRENIVNALETINEFLERIRRDEPNTRFEAFRVKDSDSFIHLMVFPDTESEQAHWNAPHTKRFVETLYPLCTEQPVYTDLAKIESVLGGEYE